MTATRLVVRQWRLCSPEGLTDGVLVFFDPRREHIRLYEGVDPDASDPYIDTVLSVSALTEPEPDVRQIEIELGPQRVAEALPSSLSRRFQDG